MSAVKGMPKKVQGIIFTEIIPPLIPEVDTASLVRLGSIVRKLNRTKVYEPLTDALRKIQWVKLMALEAATIESDIASAMEPGVIVGYPYGQVKHALAVTDALIHTKSAVDSIAVFLAEKLRLRATGGDRDFKKPKFRDELSATDPVLGQRLKELEPWFLELQDVRDEWIHRSSIRNMLIIGPSECGPLPIPRKNLNRGLGAFERPITQKDFFSTHDFVDHHYSNLVRLFRTVVDRCIEIELISFQEPPVDVEVERGMGFFPIRVTESTKITAFRTKIGPLGF